MGNVLRRSGVAFVEIAKRLGWKPGIIYQVGIGLYHRELDVMREEWPDLQAIGCEPHPGLIKGIRRDYPGAVHHVAIGHVKGRVKLFNRAKHKDGASVFPHRIEPDDKPLAVHEVEMTTLDDLFVADGGQFAYENVLLWMDCEGSELLALKGGENFIASGVDVINIELTANPLGTWCDPVDVHLWLSDHGFFRQWIHSDRLDSGQYDAVYVRPSLFRPEYCCCPETVQRFRRSHA